MADRSADDSSAPPLERAILQAAAEETVPADVRRRALDVLGLMAVAPTTAAAASISTGGAPGVHAAAHVWWQGALVKGLVAVGLAGVAAGAVVLRKPAAPTATAHTAQQTTPSPTATAPMLPAPVAARSKAFEAELPQSVPLEPGAGPDRAGSPLRKTREGPPLSPSAATKARSLALRDEIDVLDRARAALARGAAQSALSILDEYAARHPQGELRQEAAAVRERALRTTPP